MPESAIHGGVVVGVDGSAGSRAAIVWAAREAAMHNRLLTLIHIVVPVIPTATGATSLYAVPADFFRWQEDDAARVLDEARAVIADLPGEAKPPDVHDVVLHGGAVATLVDLTKDADMIVVGSRGLGAFSRALLGSVSSGLIHHAHCPVAVIHDEGSASP